MQAEVSGVEVARDVGVLDDQEAGIHAGSHVRQDALCSHVGQAHWQLTVATPCGWGCG